MKKREEKSLLIGIISLAMFAEGAFGMVLYMYTFMYNILR